jgi:hypothetical protein
MRQLIELITSGGFGILFSIVVVGAFLLMKAIRIVQEYAW